MSPPRLSTPEQEAAVLALHAVGRSIRSIAAQVRLTRQSVHRIIVRARPKPVAPEPERAPEAPPDPSERTDSAESTETVSAPPGPATVRIGRHILEVDWQGRVECPRCLHRVTPDVAAQHILGSRSGVLLPIDDEPRPTMLRPLLDLDDRGGFPW